MHLGIVASMKKGFEHFIYREVLYLGQGGARISVFPTKYGAGLYGPKPEWTVHRWHAAAVLLWQPWLLLTLGRRYLAVLREAVRYRAVVDFFLAAYFSSWMRDVDVLYATFGDRKLFVAYFGKRLTGKPLAVTLHAYELYDNPNPALFLRALNVCDQIITVSEHNRELLADCYKIPPERTELVRYSLDLREYRPVRRFAVLIVGYFVERKGHDVLFRAVQKLGRDDVEVWVVGAAGAEAACVDVPALARALEIESQVAFFGALRGPALMALYRSCDVFCLPCRTDSAGVCEGFPNVLIEAMALGKPVVTTRHVEIPRIIDAVLVDENDVDGLAAALEQVLASPAVRERLGARSRELAEEYFSTSNVEKLAGILARLSVPVGPDNRRPAEATRPGPADRDAPVSGPGRRGAKAVSALNGISR